MAQTDNKKNQNKTETFSFLMRLTTTIITALVIICFLMMIFYIVGNYQNFLDKSQQTILTFISYAAISALFLTIPVTLFKLISLFFEKNRLKTLLHIILCTFSFAFSIFCLSFSSIIDYLSKGF